MIHIALLGPTEWVMIAAVVLLLFGARKLPQLARSMGGSITAFKKGLNDDPEQIARGDDEDDDDAKS